MFKTQEEGEFGNTAKCERQPLSQEVLMTSAEVVKFAEYVRRIVWERLAPVMSQSKTIGKADKEKEGPMKQYPPLFQQFLDDFISTRDILKSIAEALELVEL